MKKLLRGSLHGLLIVMKITLRVFALQLACATILMAYTSAAQHPDKIKVTLEVKEVSLKQALQELEKLTPFTFHYSEQEIDASARVSAHVVNESVSSLLNGWLRKLGAKFSTVGANIVIKPLPPRAQTGSLMGTVTDAVSGEPLIGANVTLGNARWGAMTDVEGKFTIDKIDEGVYTVSVTYIGYTATELKNVQIQAGTATRIHVRLNAGSSSLDEVVVTAKTDIILENSSDMSVLKEIRLANNVVTGISNEQITRSMDRDAAEVVRRATGVTLADDRFAMVRGFDPRYTLTMLNDFPAPSVESDRSAFSFDLINSTNMDRVMIYKMPSAELPGNQAGGTIKIYTKNSANSNQLNIQLSTQYRPGSSFEQYHTYQGGKYDKLGFDDGTRAIPKNIPIPEEFPQPELSVPEKNAPNAVIGRMFANNWNLQKANSNLDKRAVLSYYANLSLGRMGSLNSLSSITYTQTTNINEVNRLFGYQQYDSLGINLARVDDKPVDAYNSNIRELSAIEGMRLTGMQNFRWTINDRHAIEWKNLFNQQATDRVILRDERAGAEDAAVYARTMNRKVLRKFQARTLYSGLLSGDHQLAPSLEVRWRGGFGYGSDQQPDFSSLRFATPDALPGFEPATQLGTEKIYTFVPSNTPLQSDNFRGYNDLRENTYAAMVDLSKTFPHEIVLRVGAFYEYRNRQFLNRMFGFAQSGSVYSVESPTLFENGNVGFDPKNFNNDGSGIKVYDMSGMQQASPYNNLYRYEATNRQKAGYGSVNIPLWKSKVMVYGGVRLENNHFMYPGTFQVYMGNEMVPVVIDQTKTWVLPSAMVTYKPGEQHVVRMSYGKSLNRPEFRESAPIKVTDIDRNVINEGNYKLVPAEIHNIDLRWELYPAAGDEMLSAGVYYKSITNAIEPYSQSAAGFQQDHIVPQNTPDTKGYGLELEARKRLNFMPGRLFEHMALNANVTLLRTEVNVQTVLDQSGSYNDLRRSVRPMVNASPYAVNASLYYDNRRTGTQWSVMYNTLGQRLATAGTSYTAELYIMPRNTVDISFTQSIGEHTRLKIGVQDIFNQPIRTYRDRDRSQTYNPDHITAIGTNGRQTLYVRDYMEETYKPGSYWSLGLLFSL